MEWLLSIRRDPDLKNDKEVVLVAVQQNGDALRYASPELKADKEVALARLFGLSALNR
jgi:hypothetical protein